MTYKPIFALLLIANAFTAYASVTDTAKIFYDINKYDLSPVDKVKINTLVNSIKPTDTLRIIGYADYLGSDKTNLTLSENRAEAIFNYLLSLKKSLLIITQWKGGIPASKKKTPDGDPASRRVDLIKSAGVHNTVVVRKPERGAVIIGTEDRRPFKEKIHDLAKLEVGSSLSLQEITFKPGRHFLNPEAVPCVDSLLTYLKVHTNLVFEIQGHICCVYNDGDSLDYDTRQDGLSTNRARYIYDYFLKNGISAKRMAYKGLGSSMPKVWPERSEHDSYLNRRVEIMIIGK